MKKSKRWEKAQSDELKCWSYNQERVSDPKYMALKVSYWKRILKKTGLSVEDFTNKEKSTLEVGCGPTGLFILLPPGGNRVTLLDPLLDEYKSMYKHDFNACRTVSRAFEDYDIVQNEFDQIFAINCIDHCKDIEKFLEGLRISCCPEGRIYIAINTHKRKITSLVWTRFQWLLEPHHPYHFTEEGFSRKFKKYFHIEKVIDIEDEIIWINNETKKSLPPGTSKQPLWKKVLGVFHPARIVFSILNFLGLPAHDFDGIGDSLYRHKLFVLIPQKEQKLDFSV